MSLTYQLNKVSSISDGELATKQKLDKKSKFKYMRHINLR